eukprot:m.296657 g.296657  ORF g.296657 m.296657 type:complete len:55 (+) comp294644_c0_seq1:169-333(+)
MAPLDKPIDIQGLERATQSKQDSQEYLKKHANQLSSNHRNIKAAEQNKAAPRQT